MPKSVSEVLNEISPSPRKDGKVNLGRFSKKNFNALMKAIANDPNFTVKVAKVKKGEIDDMEDILISKGFRQCIKRILETSGMDKSESVRILDDSFEFPSLDGLYEFFASAIYLYIAAGNQFDLLTTDDFEASLYMKSVPQSVSTREVKQPQTGESLGMRETTKKAHHVLATKSKCPKWLTSVKKI